MAMQACRTDNYLLILMIFEPLVAQLISLGIDYLQICRELCDTSGALCLYLHPENLLLYFLCFHLLANFIPGSFSLYHQYDLNRFQTLFMDVLG